MRRHRLLSLDTATKVTGFAVYQDDELIHYSSIDVSEIKNTDDRFRAMIGKIFSLIEREEPEAVIVEETVVSRNPQTQRMLTMILGAIYGECLKKSIHYCSLRPTQWRAAVRKKDERLPRKRDDLKVWSVNRAKELVEDDDIDDNISDAILIGRAYLNIKEAKDDGLL